MIRRPPGYGRTACPRLRAVVAALAMLVSGVLVTRAAEAAGNGARPVVVAGIVALLLQGLALLRWPALASPAIALLGILAAVALLPASNRALAPEMVVLFLGATELAGWGARLRSVIPETAASVGGQMSQIGAVVALGGVLTAVILALAGTGTVGPDGRAALVIGLLAAVVPVALLASRRWRSAG